MKKKRESFVMKRSRKEIFRYCTFFMNERASIGAINDEENLYGYHGAIRGFPGNDEENG